MTSNSSPKTAPDSIPPHTFLIVNGTQVYRLNRKTISIGRHTDNDITISDPHVSRYHAQLRVAQGYFILFDLNSTGGTSVNGERITQKVLKGGDVISLAGVPLIFGQGTVKDSSVSVAEALSSDNLSDTDTTLLVMGEEADSYLEMFDIKPQKD